MDRLFLTQQTTYKLYAALIKVEDYLRDSHAHIELRAELYDLLNEVERERDSFSYQQEY